MNLRLSFSVIYLVCTSSSQLYAQVQDGINPQQWIKTYIYDNKGALKISKQELQIVLNLLYFSFARSSITLDAQDDGLHALATSWQVFQNIIQLRRNPSKEIPYLIDGPTYTTDMKSLFDLQSKHYRIGQTYALALEAVVHGSLINNEHLAKGIQALRDDSRTSIVHALSNVREYLDAIFHMRSPEDELNPEGSMEGNKSYIDTLTKNFSIGDYIWALIPNLALDSFVKTDNLTITMSEEWWKALHQLLNISNMIWKSIERARAELYLEHYKTAYLEAKSHHIDVESMTIMFDEHGQIETNTQHDLLPDPSTLHIPA